MGTKFNWLAHFAVTLVAVFCYSGLLLAQTVYNISDDFDIAANPNEVWSYGWSAAVGSPFIPYPDSGTDYYGTEGLLFWTDSALGSLPLLWHNSTIGEETIGGSASALSNMAVMHPGRDGRHSVARWTAPTWGSYSIDARFFGRDFVGPTSTDVHVLHNGVSLLDGVVTEFGAGPSLLTMLTVAAGDTVDFVVGDGEDDWFAFDSTGISVTIAPAGEPCAAATEDIEVTNAGFELGSVGWTDVSTGVSAFYSPVEGSAYATRDGGEGSTTQDTGHTIEAGASYELTVWARSTNGIGNTNATDVEVHLSAGESTIVSVTEDVNPMRLLGDPQIFPSDDGGNVWIDQGYRMAFADSVFYQLQAAHPLYDPWTIIDDEDYDTDNAVGQVITDTGFRGLYSTYYEDSPPYYSEIWLNSGTGSPPDYDWSGGTVVLSHEPEEFPWVIDPSLYYDEDTGRLWMLWGGGDFYVSEMDPVDGMLLDHPASTEFDTHPAGTHTMVARRTQSDAWSSAWAEGASLYKHDEYWYCFISAGHLAVNYTIRVGRGTSPTGPFYDKDGVDMLSEGGTLILGHDGGQSNPGHPSIWEEGGQFYMGYDYVDRYPGAEVVDRFGIRNLRWVDGWLVVAYTPITVRFNADDYPEMIGETLGVGFRNVAIGSSAAFDEVSLRYTVPADQSITVTSPNGGETLVRGSVATITWTTACAVGNPEVSISLYRGTQSRVIVDSTGNTGSFDWAIPANFGTGSNYRIGVNSLADPAIGDLGDGVFTITENTPPPPPASDVITVVSPNGGEELGKGTVAEIQWSTTDAVGHPSVSITIWRGTRSREIVSSTPNDGAFDWAIPTNYGTATNYTIEISSVADPGVSDVSDGTFAIGEASPPPPPPVSGVVTVVAPNGGEVFGKGTVEAITWSTTDAVGHPAVSIKIWRGTRSREIVSSTPNDGSFDWAIPTNYGTASSYTIEISSVADPGVTDVSDGTFTIQ